MRGWIGLVLVGPCALGLFLLSTESGTAQKQERPPHNQDTLPGPALSPAEAIAKMKVPPGFTVELVAGEPNTVNPVAMTFDERGRAWITESLEYPRSSPGVGKDRIKILEDTDGDGKADKFTIFAEGLNIPSGIAVGQGGVWVANAPDILFLQDTDGDGKADKREVVVTGFGRDDTHELPNSLTWGPDGWLYGLNGVFNRSVVKQGGKTFDFTCALFRIHPKTREFQLFAEGTSNPWGVAWDIEGSAFLSACVIDHLWHLAESGYYHRQGGPYPAHTWKLESIVKHKHQKAAYCGLHYFDSDAYPAEYRERLYMGNIHGNCINSDILTRDGASYFAKPAPDFLSANDSWFMPVVQKTGPDGCLYILDWYDRYHCYQDARRDPAGIDRLRGRLYRVRYKDSPRAPQFDLAKETDDQLMERLKSPNVYFRDQAQRLLRERGTREIQGKLQRFVLDESIARKSRLHGLWALVGSGPLEEEFALRLLNHGDAGYRAWAVRASGDARKVSPAVRDKVVSLTRDPAPDVQLQVAVAARKLDGVAPIPLLLDVLNACGEDKIIPNIVWQNLHPLLEGDGAKLISSRFAALLPDGKGANLVKIAPRVIERALSGPKADPSAVLLMIETIRTFRPKEVGIAQQALLLLTERIQNRELPAEEIAALSRDSAGKLDRFLEKGQDDPCRDAIILLGATLKDPRGLTEARQLFDNPGRDEAMRAKALDALIAAGEESALDLAEAALSRKTSSDSFRGLVLASLAKLDRPGVAGLVLERFPQFGTQAQARAIELLCQRVVWSQQLLSAIEAKKIAPSQLNVNHVRRILAAKDADITKRVERVWGRLREDRNPEREKLVRDMRNLIGQKRGDPKAGAVVFKNICAQCHKIHGDGVEVGPDLTVNGRSSFDQLLSNTFDPSLVIGASYQAVNVSTTKGRLLTGLLVEDSPDRLVLKTQGGKLEEVARREVDEVAISNVSLMPEGFEKQLKPQEIVDLFAFLALDKGPGDPAAKKIPGAP